MFGRKLLTIPDPSEALPGRAESMPVPDAHYVIGRPLIPPFPDGVETLVVGMGCFWGAERKFWEVPGIWTTSVGYVGGHTPNPTYEEVCTGLTGHNEVVLVAWESNETSLAEILRVFWENHDPTQGMRQGNDLGTQYRSGIYVLASQRAAAEATRDAYAARLAEAGWGEVTTEVVDRPEFFYAEEHHQQYLAKNPMGYCGIGGTGVSCPIGVLS
ncbi:MAG TPA: peptide-methionine (S)-S-oxide reductase [Acidimicrobiaceae bacterium]|nr:peptide-methionine (S)-S-oxide reductase [Acidimicrobiaceae bacterium]HCV33260.1 peptide-methionine (S)-S-oxide reductase [Acidimicrobiaceae bacterium]|tara:strand:+ start:255 stop:896 length:642 start_codon:yes stop_codon:yes gene_type:complete